MGHSCHAGRCGCILDGYACSILCHKQNIKISRKCEGCTTGHHRLDLEQSEQYSSAECDNSTIEEHIVYFDHDPFQKIPYGTFGMPVLPCGRSKGSKTRPGLAAHGHWSISKRQPLAFPMLLCPFWLKLLLS
jgi:hypothetical protein